MTPRLKPSRSNAIAMGGVAVVALSVALRMDIFARLNSYYDELASVAATIPPGSRLMALRLSNTYQGKPFPAQLDVLIQAGSRLASSNDSVDVKNFQGQSRDHPIQFRPGVSATALLGGDRAITSLPPRIDLMAYERETGNAIDYVLLYGFPVEVENRNALRRIDEQLARDYRLLDTSEPTGLARIYERIPGQAMP